MDDIKTCTFCNSKPCKETRKGTFDICEYGIAFYNSGSSIKKKAPHVTLRNLSRNLRHEINPILQLIIQQAGLIDETVSIKRIDLSKPASKIVGASIIIDYLIQMITGVNDFHATAYEPSAATERAVDVPTLIRKYFTIHGLLKNIHRAENLHLQIKHTNEATFTRQGSDLLEYIFCILFDNIWKYSLSDTAIRVTFEKTALPDYYNIVIRNLSKPIPPTLDIFAFGAKGDTNSKGFGFGLHWAQVLTQHFNEFRLPEEPALGISHNETTHAVLRDHAIQYFSINNVLLEESS